MGISKPWKAEIHKPSYHTHTQKKEEKTELLDNELDPASLLQPENMSEF